MDQIRKKITVGDQEKWVFCPFRSLTNYKALHGKRAKEMGVYAEFMAATTLTQARRIVFG
jgi:hypothetical protein